MKWYKIVLVLFSVSVLFSCSVNQKSSSTKKTALLEIDNLYPWCIVPFDVKKRTPEARIQMLQDLGFRDYAYDGKKEHLPEMAREWALAKEKGINIRAIWMWIDDRWDEVGKLNETNDKLFKLLTSEKMETQIWVGFHANYFEGLDDTAAIEKGIKMVEHLSKKAKAVNCTIGLYNHGAWFGEPENQIKIIKALPDFEIGLVYNFHHGYNQVERFTDFVDEMLPYLWSVNLSGVKKGAYAVFEIGQGDYEKKMIEILLEKSYDKPFGILGHRKEKDVAKVLKGNLEGLAALKIVE